MKDLIIIFMFFLIPFLPWKRLYALAWDKFEVYLPDAVKQFDTLLRKKWSLIKTSHLFLFSFILTMILVYLYFFGTFLGIPTIPLPLGISVGMSIPFLFVYILRPNIEAGFLFEIRLIYSALQTQIVAGAKPKEALELAIQVSEILQDDLKDILLAWGGDIYSTIECISLKYDTDELDILLSLITEMNQAGAKDQKNVIDSFDKSKEMMEDQLAAKELAKDEQEMELVEGSSFILIFAMFFLLVIPIVGDIVNLFNNIQ